MKKSGRIGLLVCIVAAALVSAVAIWAVWGRNAARTDAPANDGSLQKVLDAGRFVLGLDADFPPMSFTDGWGTLTGFDIEMVQEVCKRLGVEFVKRPIDWTKKEEELNGGTIDALASMSDMHESAKRMLLSDPYVRESLIFVVSGSSSARSLNDLKGRKIGVQAGSTTQEELEALDIYKEVSAVALKDNLAILRELKQGTLDAGLVDSIAAYYFVALSNERYFVLPERLGEEKITIGFRKNDKALRDRVQEIINEMKADGTLGKISERWFDSDITIVR